MKRIHKNRNGGFIGMSHYTIEYNDTYVKALVTYFNIVLIHTNAE